MKEAAMTALVDRPGHAFRNGTASGLTRRLVALRDAWSRHKEINALRDELQRLSDRELADIGISRLSIGDIARSAVASK
ncbi:MAG TPA: DUF1127 domain-containing protein [Amaricoccus sp.]|uniref:DUF1127 domain-containing protein n=1 Tax=Amaricoccus sp. TaxID=1872485 RepID=UPI002C4752A2|nr:DUF1127 domain-containing protein [Amaricoccus sp.]HMQ92736.1 DUF1127 domain-containing protein [Amaricoccus sp.]HMR53716.1 DUF1127 domain-containing protein [Amaricoccus sp.]HMR59757.1 DUF1127 domain-containing protein [Amaricoccus sp.]HMT98943.1 DUF1127 domain-containing protein [Amaricoccus sp.]